MAKSQSVLSLQWTFAFAILSLIKFDFISSFVENTSFPAFFASFRGRISLSLFIFKEDFLCMTLTPFGNTCRIIPSSRYLVRTKTAFLGSYSLKTKHMLCLCTTPLTAHPILTLMTLSLLLLNRLSLLKCETTLLLSLIRLSAFTNIKVPIIQICPLGDYFTLQIFTERY